MSENSIHADTSDDEQENFLTDTPSLMLEISEALGGMSRPEMAVFPVDDSDSDSESQSDNTTPETDKPTENGKMMSNSQLSKRANPTVIQ